jgi:hypothetical protein
MCAHEQRIARLGLEPIDDGIVCDREHVATIGLGAGVQSMSNRGEREFSRPSINSMT